jgi:uncharacterized membrane protein YhaH (DUF805 family)
MHYMFLPFKRYFDFSGRSRRKEYWMFTLLNLIVLTIYVLVFFFLFGNAVGDPLSGSFDGTGSFFSSSLSGWIVLGLLWLLFVLIPGLSVSVRRLHDRDLSGWWYLAYLVGSGLPFIGFIVIIGFFVVMAMPGTIGSNRFGPDPEDNNTAEVFA